MSTGGKTVACSSCGADIIWATSPAGKRMPIDAKLVPLRTLPKRAVPYVVRYDEHPDIHGTPWLEVHVDHGDPECGVFVSHFVTCPNASTHSKRAGKTSVALCIALAIVTVGLPACKGPCGNVGPGATGVDLRRC